MAEPDHATVDEDVVDVLIAQHAQIQNLFLLASTGDGSRAEAFEQLVHLLAVHETAEEEIVHPLSRTLNGGLGGMVDDRLGEERAAKQMLTTIIENGVDAPDYPRALAELREAVLEHARHEERYEFPRLRHEVDPDRLRALATALRAAEAVAPTRPHPGTESATANAALGLPLAVIDRIRDAVRGAASS